MNYSNNKIEIHKVDDFIFDMVKKYMIDIEKLDKLSEILNDIGKDPYTYILYKSYIPEYKKIFGDEFDEINEIIKKINKFGESRNSMDPKCVNMLYETIASFTEYKDIMDLLDDDDRKYINIIKKIYIEKDK